MNRSKATAALQRFKEIDKKYKVRYDDSKNAENSSENTVSLFEEKEYKKKFQKSPSLKKQTILKPTLSIKIPDTFTERLDTETTSDDVLPSPGVSIIDETARAKSISEIQEVLDEEESIVEVLNEFSKADSMASKGIDKNVHENSNENESLAITVENISMESKEAKDNYSDDSFENYSSGAESIDSYHLRDKHSNSPANSHKSIIAENEIPMSVHRVENTAEFENAKEEIKIKDWIDSAEELAKSVNIVNTPFAESNLNLSKYSTIEKFNVNQQTSETLKMRHSIHEKLEESSSQNKNFRQSEKNDHFESDELPALHEVIDASHSKLATNSSKISSTADDLENIELSSICKSPQSQREKLSKSSIKNKDSKSSSELSVNEELSPSVQSRNSSRSKIDTNKASSTIPRKIKSSSSESSKDRKKNKDPCRVFGKVEEFKIECGSKRDDIQQRREYDNVTLSDKQPEKGLKKNVRRIHSAIEIQAPRDSMPIVKKKILNRKRRYRLSGDHRENRTNTDNLKISKSAPIFRSNETASFERKDRELERLRSRINDLHLERERQLLLCYMRDFDEERKRLVLFSNQFHCPSKPKVSIIKPLEFPNVANFMKPDTTGLGCKFLLPDDNLELVKNRIAEIRQWLKDQFILYREYSDVAAAINSKYVTDDSVEKVSAHVSSFGKYLQCIDVLMHGLASFRESLCRNIFSRYRKRLVSSLHVYDYDVDNRDAIRNPLAQGNVYKTLALRLEITTKKALGNGIKISP